MSVGKSYRVMSSSCTVANNWRADFSNILSKSGIERLAEVDEYEVVREVQVR